MTYLSDKQKSRKQIVRTICIALALLLISYGWIEIRSKAYPYVEPIAHTSGGVMERISAFPHTIGMYFYTRNYYDRKIAALESSIEELENRNALLEGIATVSLSHEESISKNLRTVVLYSLGHDVTTLYNSMLLSKGFKDGLQAGMMVYVRGRQGVCAIEEVHAVTARCKLLSSAGVKTEGVIVNASSTEVLPLTGDGGGAFIASIPKGTNIPLASTVVYKADPTMKLGTVVDIQDDPQDVFMRVYIRGAYNPVSSSVFYVDKE